MFSKNYIFGGSVHLSVYILKEFAKIQLTNISLLWQKCVFIVSFFKTVALFVSK